MREQLYALDSGRLRVLRAGEGAQGCLVIHGAGGNANTWRQVLPADSSWSYCAVDLPGRGGIDGAALESIEAMAERVKALIECLGLQRPILIGHSMGGAVALSVALRGVTLGGLVMVSSGAKLRVAPTLIETIAQAKTSPSYGFAFGADSAPEAVERYDAAAAATPIPTIAADWRACDRFDVRARLGELDCDTLVLYGDRDAMTPPKHQRRMINALPRAASEVFAGVGHMLPWETPDAMWRAVHAWSRR